MTPGGSGGVAALVLTWNSADLIERCVESLLRAEVPPHVLVVDNDSSDGTVELVRKRFADVEVLETGENLGFAGGCNAGLRQLLAGGFESVLLLNPDAYTADDCVERLAAHLARVERCAAVSPAILDHDSEIVWFGGGEIDWTTGATYHLRQGEPVAALPADAYDTARINGGAVLLRASALEQVGLFDEDYFLYYEETDLSVRLVRAGWSLQVLPGARAWHEASSSTGGNLGPVFNYYLTRGRLLFLRKLGGPGVRWSRVILHLARETRWLTKTFGLRSLPAVRQRLRALVDFVRRRTGRVPF